MLTFENYDQATIVSDLGAVFEPKTNLSDDRVVNTWAVVPYETNQIKGTLLSAMANSKPEPVTFDPHLKGWYAIFVGLPSVHVNAGPETHLKLSSDRAYREFRYRGLWRRIKEFFWKCADMTDEKVILAKMNEGIDKVEGACWFRFVPMTEEEVAAYQADQNRTDTRTMYCHYDMHDAYYHLGKTMNENPLIYTEILENSDIEWVTLENHKISDGPALCGDLKKMQLGAAGYEFTNQFLQRNPEVYPRMIERLHEMGRKVALAHRMGMWALGYPYDDGQFRNSFWNANKHLRCIDRDGQAIDAMSYAYPEVQDYMISLFMHSASFHPDAVQMMFNRCPVAILFEQPVLERFAQKYPGVDMRVLPLEDPRVREIHCEFMTAFVRKLRAALDQYTQERGWTRIELHVRTMCTVYDTLLMGVDLEQWAKEGLIDAIIHYPRRTREQLPDEVFADETHEAIDLAKYTKYANELNVGSKSVIYFSDDQPFYPPWPDHKGVMHGPADLKEALEEFVSIGKRYGIPFYYELMPRSMTPEEYRNRVQFAYDAGVNHLSLWDINSRWAVADQWPMVAKLGHRDELADLDVTSPVFGHEERVLNIGGIDYSRYVPCHGG